MTIGSEGLSSRPLLRHLAEYWWLVLLRGIAAVVFGLLAFFMPAIAGLSLVFLWGAYTLADGILSLWAGIAGKEASTGSRWWLAITGLLGIAAGLIAFFAPGLTAGILLIFIAIWAIIIGVMAIIGAIQLRKEIEGEWLLILSGAIAVIFGVLMFTRPASAALAVVWMIATFAIVFGIDMILLAFKLKSHRRA
jgi:uncharacterized membrane protein HdeD (DUF308 family)